MSATTPSEAAVRSAVTKPVIHDPRQTDIEAPDQLGRHTHNQQRDAEVGGIAGDRLRSIIERVERMEEEKKALSDDIKDIFLEAKSAGFDVVVLRQLIRQRKKEPAEVEEQESLLDLYKRALGM